MGRPLQIKNVWFSEDSSFIAETRQSYDDMPMRLRDKRQQHCSIGTDSLACTHAVRALPLSRTTKEAKRSFLVAIVRRENCLIWFLIDFSFIARQFSFLLVCHAAAQCFTTQLTYAFIRKAACLCFSVGCHLVRFTYLPFNYLCPRLSLTATAFATPALVGQALQVGKGYNVPDKFTAHKKSICSNYQ